MRDFFGSPRSCTYKFGVEDPQFKPGIWFVAAAREFMSKWTPPETSSFSEEYLTAHSMGVKLDGIMKLSPESNITKGGGGKSGSLWAVPLLSELDVLAAKYAALTADHEALKKSHATLREELERAYAEAPKPLTQNSSPFGRFPSVVATLAKETRAVMSIEQKTFIAEV